MQTYIALLRGINVGGNHIVKMAELKILCAQLGFENIRTYIQSGNVIFDSNLTDKAEFANQLGLVIEQKYGFLPKIFILEKAQLLAVLAKQSLSFDDEKYVYLYFLQQPAKLAKLADIEALMAIGDEYKLTDDVFYLHCPNGIGKSKLLDKLEILLGVKTTTRNLRSVKKIIGLLG
ncbi:MAG: DUF1697 domain-containing protein [Rhizobiales bacterium]|nr:DUF1697 domain-containing protein [Hyphomicrobiales bacterium]NRB14711.1 DUF1697 domain-containing protein [Hyphomicrobiales bacterium]